jgi:hypothetical protein
MKEILLKLEAVKIHATMIEELFTAKTITKYGYKQMKKNLANIKHDLVSKKHAFQHAQSFL